jgi:amidohydrolase
VLAVEDVLAAEVDRRHRDLVDLSHRIHAHPEPAWQEVRAAGWVAQAMSDGGFEVELGYLGLATAVRAQAGPGPLTVVLCAEYDALPGLGHACGHNVIAASSVGAALALAAVADRLGLRVVLLGTPAEEGGGGKIELLQRGGFRGAHLSLLAHPGPVDVPRARPYAVSHLRIGFTGRAAHAAAYPERGLNAADAFTVAQVAIGLLRQQLPDEVRVHGLLTRGGEAPNAIPARTEGRWYVRGLTTAQRIETEQRVLRCFEAGALATGCEWDVAPESEPYAEFRTDEPLLARYLQAAARLGRAGGAAPGDTGRISRASTDLGNVSQLLPAIHPYIGIDSGSVTNHQPEFAAAAVRPAADAAIRDAAVLLAWTVAGAAEDAAERNRLLSLEGAG